jgi:uncharacterized protein
LAYPTLNPRRRALVRGVRSLAKDPEAAAAALGLGPKLRSEIDRNRAVTVSATMPAIDRYTGVLYDALDASSLDGESREFAGSHVVIHSALFGLVGALDPIPAYRLSHNSKVPGLPLKKHWSDSVTSVLGIVTGPVLDFRSEAYVALGPVPAGVESVFLRVVTKDADGKKRALNHFNKASKGALARALSLGARDFRSVEELLEWAAGSGFALHRGAPGELELTV